VFEAIEPRLLLDSTPLITEFLADNDNGIETRVRASTGDPFTGDDMTPDWIEIHNPTDTPVDLAGWYLTDDVYDPENPEDWDLWAFPSTEPGVTVLDPDEYLVVYATGEDVTDPDLDETGRLHTDFGLSRGGEYLALVAPAGTPADVVSEFDFPEQESDVSYGLYESIDTRYIAPQGSTGYTLIPDGPEGGWTDEAYDHSAWLQGDTGIGFETMIPGFATRVYMANISVTSVGSAESVISNPSKQQAVYQANDPVVDYYNTGGHGHTTEGEYAFPGLEMGVDASNFAVEVTGVLTFPTAGEWTFVVNSDEGFSLNLQEQEGDASLFMQYWSLRTPADSVGVLHVTTPGMYDLRLVTFEASGGAEVELWAAEGNHAAWNETDFFLVGDTDAGSPTVMSEVVAGLTGYSRFIRTDVQDAMFGQNASAYLRVPFNVVDPADYESLYLQMWYEDGFVAYLNGTKVAEANAPASPAWDASATAERPKTEAVQRVDIDLTAHMGLLHTGTNVLAVQGLNLSAADGDFLLLPVLAELAFTGVVPHFFTTVSPGGPNLDAYLARCGDTAFSVDRGFYDAPFDVEITTSTVGATIWYTLNGSSPLDEDGQPSDDAIPYAGPITVSTSTVLRAAATRQNYLPTNVDTQTYVFPSAVLSQPGTPAGFPSSWGGTSADYQMDPDITNSYSTQQLLDGLNSLPSMSLVMDLDDLFGSSDGIYANPMEDGENWERPGSIELFYPTGYEAEDDGFQVDCGVRIYGGVGRRESFRKHSFRLLFKGEYGATKLEYPLFGDDAVDEFDTIILRSNFNDQFQNGGAAGQHIRDEWARRVQLAVGTPSATGEFVHLYVNGLYWGLYNPCERPDQSIGPAYFGGGDKDNWDAMNSGAATGESDTAEWSALRSFVANNDITQYANYMRVQGANPDGSNNPNYPCLLDAYNYAVHLMTNMYFGNTDWPNHNWYAARQEDPGSTGWKWFTWDAEWIMDRRLRHRDVDPLYIDVTYINDNAAQPYSYLRHNEEFQTLFGDVAHATFFDGGPLYVNPDDSGWDPAEPERNRPAAMYAELADLVELAIITESARWGDAGRSYPITPDQWAGTRDWILNSYLPYRNPIFIDQLRSAGLYPDVDAPWFNINGEYQHGGTISSGDVFSISSPYSPAEATVYYTLDGTDPREVGGGVADAAVAYAGAVAINANTAVKARVYDGSEWSALVEAIYLLDTAPPLRVTEVMYNPAPPTAAEIAAGFDNNDDFEYLELKNIGDQPIDLAGLEFVDGITFIAPSTTLNPGKYALIVKNQAAFQFRYGTSHGGMAYRVIGEFTGGTNLSNAGENLYLQDHVGGLIHDFDWADGWYGRTDGQGYSLVVRDADQALDLWDDKDGWRPSWQFGGNPGAADPGPDLHAVVVSEILAHTDGPDGDWVELMNTSGAAVDIDGWYLSDSDADLAALTKYQISSASVDTLLEGTGAGRFLVLTQAADFGATFALSEFGEGVFLTGRVDEADIYLAGSSASWPTGWYLAGYREDEYFGATPSEQTLGRHVKSTGGSDFVLMAATTRGAENASPAIPPVVINEVMYHPPDEETQQEWIELHNRTGADVNLWEHLVPGGGYPEMDVGWAFTDGIRFTFPVGAYVPADGYALVVQADPDAFRTEHGIPSSVPVYGPFEAPPDDPGNPSRLANDGERLALSRPGDPEVASPPPGETAPYVPYIEIEKLTYNDSPPWDVRADGGGYTLARIDPDAYIDDATNWPPSTSGGTPGAENTDFDFTPPSVPTGVGADVVSPDEIRVDWFAASDPETGILYYVVYRDGVPINVTEETFLVDATAQPSVTYAYEVSAVNLDYMESARSAPPAEARIVSAEVVATPGGDTVSVRFSEAVTQASSQDLGAYTVSYDGGAGEIDVLDADRQADGVTVLLTLAQPLTAGELYVLSIRGVQAESDRTPVAPDCDLPFQRFEGGSGTILRQWWTGIPGTAISDLTGHIDYPENPDGEDELTLLETPGDWGSDYGTRVVGYVHAPVTGSYTFWIASDDASELWLSTDETPANKVRIAHVDGWTAPRDWDDPDATPSDPVVLELGCRYYIEVLHKEGSGGDHLAVAWTLPGENPDDNGPIPGDYLSPFLVEPLPVVSITAADADADEQGQDTATFTIARDIAGPDPLVVRYLVSGASDGDYQELLPGTVAIPAFETSVDITVTPVDDDENEPDETLTLTLEENDAYEIQTGAGEASATIVDNEFASVEAVVLNPHPGRTIRTVGEIEPSGIGVQTVEITFSEPVTFTPDAVTVQRVHFEGGSETVDHTFGPGEVTVDGSGTAVMTVTVADAHTEASDTWIKVTLSDAAADLACVQGGHALDGEPRLDSSGLGYVRDAAADLSTGDGVPGGEAAFYVGNLRGDVGGYLYGPPDNTVDYWDLVSFTNTYQSGSLDADFGGYLYGPPDGAVDYWDLVTFTNAYQATSGTSLSPLPVLSQMTLVEETAEKWALVPDGDIGSTWRTQITGYDTGGWKHFAGGSPGGIGYENGSGYQDYIGLDVSEMSGGNTSCYVRIPFLLGANPAGILDMTLYVRYDDGFVAYINGEPIERANYSHDYPAWDENADGNHNDGEAVDLLAFSIDPSHYDALVQGENLLAIHGLNVGSGSSDFLISVALEVTIAG
jgi:hypothetical protein